MFVPIALPCFLKDDAMVAVLYFTAGLVHLNWTLLASAHADPRDG